MQINIFISMIAFAGVGVLLISYVQIGIIKGKGFRHFGERGLVNVYWRDRTIKERVILLVGLGLLVLPSALLILFAQSNAAV